MSRHNPIFDAAITVALFRAEARPTMESRKLQEVTGDYLVISEWWRYTFTEKDFVSDVLARAFELEGYDICVDNLALSDKFKYDYEGYLYERDRDGISAALEDIESIRLYFCTHGTVYIDINYIKEVYNDNNTDC